MDGSFFYTNIDEECGSDFDQDYKDKVPISNLRSKKRVDFILAIGLNDFAGTGFYSSEYIVGSYGIDNIDFHFGVGWGNLNGKNSYKNPFIYLSDSFEFRPTELEDQGGQVQLSQYFSDKTISPFFGISYAFNEKIIMQYEVILQDPEKLAMKNSKVIIISLKYNINKVLQLDSHMREVTMAQLFCIQKSFKIS